MGIVARSLALALALFLAFVVVFGVVATFTGFGVWLAR